MRQATPRVLVGIATVTPDRRFVESLPAFSQDVGKKGLAHLDFLWVWNKPLVEAQNEMAEVMRKGDHDYLLTLEDDHWAFTGAMLEACLATGAEVSAISYRSRHFPFPMLPERFMKTDAKGVRRFTPFRSPPPQQESDLCGFGFTLIAKRVFEVLDQPTFRLNTQYYKGVGPHATDIDFCYRVQAKGMRIVGCFDHILPHREITEDGYKDMVVGGILAKHSMFTYMQELAKKGELRKKGLTKGAVNA